MSFDGVFTYAIVGELQEALAGGSRKSTSRQRMRSSCSCAPAYNHKVMLSAHPTYARVHLTNETYDNPPEPPMFCMRLRKHLEGSIVEAIRQVEFDRIIVIDTKGRDELGDVQTKQLIIEVMGRHSNIILVDASTNTIIDSLKHLPPSVNRYRTVLLGIHTSPADARQAESLEATEETMLKNRLSRWQARPSARLRLQWHFATVRQ
ncbi:hypothetical protein F6Y03_00625 [Bacillus megaterium]|nr:hypothetical protein [Priestia megaterium]